MRLGTARRNTQIYIKRGSAIRIKKKRWPEIESGAQSRQGPELVIRLDGGVIIYANGIGVWNDHVARTDPAGRIRCGRSTGKYPLIKSCPFDQRHIKIPINKILLPNACTRNRKIASIFNKNKKKNVNFFLNNGIIVWQQRIQQYY